MSLWACKAVLARLQASAQARPALTDVVLIPGALVHALLLCAFHLGFRLPLTDK